MKSHLGIDLKDVKDLISHRNTAVTWGMEEDTPVMMVDIVSTVVIPAGRESRAPFSHNVALFTKYYMRFCELVKEENVDTNVSQKLMLHSLMSYRSYHDLTLNNNLYFSDNPNISSCAVKYLKCL